MSIFGKSIKAIGWNSVSLIVGFPMKFVLNIVLARLLTPKDYGLIIIPLVFVAISDLLVESGLKSSLIHTNKVDSYHYSSVFYFNTGIAFFIYLCLFLASFPLEYYFEVERLGLYVRILSLSFIFKAFYLVHEADASINLDFKKQSLIELTSYLVAYIVAIFLASNQAGVNSLLAFHLTISGLTMILYWLTTRWNPSFYKVKKILIKKHWQYGKSILGGSIIAVIAGKLDVTLLNKFVSPASLGLFVKAKEYSDLISLSSSKLFARPAMPIFSKINSHIRFKILFLDAIQLICFFYIIIVLILFVNIEQLFLVILGEKWIKLTPILKILLPSSVLYIYSTFSKYIILSKGKPNINFNITIITSILRILGVVTLLISFKDHHSLIIMMAFWELFVQLFDTILVSYFLHAEIDISFKDQFISLHKILFFSFIISMSLFCTNLLSISLFYEKLCQSLIILTVGLLLGIKIIKNNKLFIKILNNVPIPTFPKLKS